MFRPFRPVTKPREPDRAWDREVEAARTEIAFSRRAGGRCRGKPYRPCLVGSVAAIVPIVPIVPIDVADRDGGHFAPRDREPDGRYREAAFATFDRLDKLTGTEIGASADPFEKSGPYLRFAPDALVEFRGWRASLEARLRSDELHPAVESHIGKYRKLVPTLALIHHLASDGVGPVGVVSVLSALSWAEFLESHAHRIYGASLNCAVDGGKTILRHIRAGDLQSGFFARDIQRRAWANLGDDKDRVKDALDLLEDHGWLRTLKPEIGPSGGNPGVRYIINPKATER